MNSRNLIIAFLFLIAVAVFFTLGIYVGSTQFAPSASPVSTEAVPTVQSRASTEPLSPTDVRGDVPTALPATSVPETSQNQVTETSSEDNTTKTAVPKTPSPRLRSRE